MYFKCFFLQSSGDELQVVRDNLQHLRTNFPSTGHQSIDDLEHSIAILMDRLHINSTLHSRVSGKRATLLYQYISLISEISFECSNSICTIH